MRVCPINPRAPLSLGTPLPRITHLAYILILFPPRPLFLPHDSPTPGPRQTSPPHLSLHPGPQVTLSSRSAL